MNASINCPICVNSSGYTYFTGPNQKCSDCNGTGKVSKTKYKELKATYGDLI